MSGAYAPLLILFGLSVVDAIGMVVASQILNPRRPTPQKEMPYESGMIPLGDTRTWSRSLCPVHIHGSPEHATRHREISRTPPQMPRSVSASASEGTAGSSSTSLKGILWHLRRWPSPR